MDCFVEQNKNHEHLSVKVEGESAYSGIHKIHKITLTGRNNAKILQM